MDNILIIGAHFDDSELGVGGTAAKLVSQGCNVYKLTLTDNDVPQSAFNARTDGSESLTNSLSACEVLGVKSLDDEFERIKVCELAYSRETMQRVEKIILVKKIDTVFIHDEHDTNQDHAQSGIISKTAARHCDNILIYQSNLYINSQGFYPTVFYDITEFVSQKRFSLSQYGKEHQRYASVSESENTLFEHVILQNKVWGYSVGVDYAEGFVPIKMKF